jgi:Wiskott-Aldrich syndrome protein
VIQGDIKYKQDKSCFHSFVGTSNMVGLSFADEEDSLDFKEKVMNREQYTPAQKLVPTPVQQIDKSLQDSSESLSKKSNGGLFGRKSTKETKSKIDKSMISGPTDFQHVSHVGFSTTTGYNVQNIPTEWKLIFEKAGITDEQLKDRKQMKLAKKFMRDNAGLLDTQKAEQPSSQLPATRKAAPPPPPPSRASISGTSSRPQTNERAAPPPPARAATKPDTPIVPARVQNTPAIPPTIPTRSQIPPTIPDRGGILILISPTDSWKNASECPR